MPEENTARPAPRVLAVYDPPGALAVAVIAGGGPWPKQVVPLDDANDAPKVRQ